MGIFESIFDMAYLVTVITLSIAMIKQGETGSLIGLFGLMGLILGLGDAFHLIPRIISHLTNDFESHAVALGYGKMMTSISMTIFYVILYRIWEIRFGKKDQSKLRFMIGGLALIRMVLVLMPQNAWASLEGSYAWGVYRNIPFTLMGIVIVGLLIHDAKKHEDLMFKKIGIAVIISFTCYLPVVLFASRIPAIGALMMPKTIAYLMIVIYGYQEMRRNTLTKSQ